MKKAYSFTDQLEPAIDYPSGVGKLRTMAIRQKISSSGARPTLWRTCRALANTTRLEIIQELIRQPNQPVSTIARKLKLSRSVASRHLRILSARGLLHCQRRGAWVYYTLEPDATIPEAKLIIQALKEVFQTEQNATKIIFQLVTAFTHPQRQAVYEALRKTDSTFTALRQQTAISVWALRRHLNKLARRGFVVSIANTYRAVAPPGRLARLLANLAPEAAR